MKRAIKEYGDALEAHLEAQKQEGVAKDHLRKTRHALLMARQGLKMMEEDVLEDNVRDL